MPAQYAYWIESAIYWDKRKQTLWAEFLTTHSLATLDYHNMCERQWQFCVRNAEEAL